MWVCGFTSEKIEAKSICSEATWRTKWDLYPATDPKAPCFVHIHGGYWQRGSKETFACLAEGALAHGWAAALPGYTLAPEASLTQITDELRTAFDWLDAEAAEHGIEGLVIVTGWSAGGHLTAFILDHRKVAAGLSISAVFDLAPLRDSPHVNDKVQLTELEIETLSPMRRPGVNKPLSIAYGTGELPAMIASSRDYHAHRARAHLPGDLIPVVNTNHFTILDELRHPDQCSDTRGLADGRIRGPIRASGEFGRSRESRGQHTQLTSAGTQPQPRRTAVARPITPPPQCVHVPLPPQIAQTRPSPARRCRCRPLPLQT